MYAKRIIPCLDVKNGRVVKGVSFVDLRDAGDPVECAAAYDKQGADELVLLDITALIDGETLFEGDWRDSCTVDGCHPNDLGFACMAKVFSDAIEKMLGL